VWVLSRRSGINAVTLLIYIILALAFLKLFKILPGSPEYELYSIVATFIGSAVGILTVLTNWLGNKFAGLEESIKKIEASIQGMSDRVLRLEVSMGAIEKGLAYGERLTRIEEQLKARES